MTKVEELLGKFQQTVKNAAGGDNNIPDVDTIDLAQAYLASERNFKNSMDTCPLGVRIVTEDGDLIYANKAALDIFGYKTVEELAAVKKSDLYTPESYAAFQERKRKRKLNEHVPGEYELGIRRPDGEVRNLMVFRREVMWGGEKQYMAMYEDITERKRVEAALKDSEEKYHSLVEQGNDGIVYIEDRLIRYCNSKMLEISGYAMEELIDKPFIDFIVPEQKNNAAEMYKQRVAGMKVPDRYELDIISRDGTTVHTEISANLINFRQKLIDIVIVRDITDRKKMYDALRQTEEMFSKAFRSSPDAVMIITLDDGIIIDANDAAVKNTGYSLNEMIEHSTLELNLWVNPEDSAKIQQSLEKNGRVSQEVYQFRTKSGEIRTWEYSAEPILIGNKKCLLSVQRDITEQKQAEEALKESQQMFSLAFRDSPNLMLISTLKEGQIIEVNDAYCQATGYSRKELIGHTTLELNLWHDPKQRGSMAESLEKRRAVSNAEVRFRAKSGEIRTFSLSIAKITLKEEPYLISIASDITERKQAEDALEESETRFRSLFETMAQGVIYQLADGKIISANPAAQRILGLSIDQILGRTSTDPRWKSIYENGTDFPGEEHPSMVALRTGKAVENVVMGVFNPKINEHKWILVSAIPEFREGETIPYRVYTTFSDITEQKKAEKALQESEERYRLIFENSKDAILLTSLDGGILAANPEACRMFGRSEEDICRIGRGGVIDVADPRLEKALEKRKATGEFSGDLIGVRADGTKFPIELSSKVFYDKDGKARTSMIIRDTTERKRMEEQLERDSEEIKLIIDSAPILVFYKDLKGKFLRINKAMATALNMAEKDLLGKTVFDLFSKDIAQGMSNDDREVFTTGHPKLNILEQYESAAGMRWVQTDKIPILDNDGKVIGLVGFAQDITEQKEAEEARKASEDRVSSIFSVAPIGIVVLVDRTFTEVNEGFCEMVGYTRDELLGQSSQIVYNSNEEYEYAGKIYSQMTATGTGTLETRLRHKDGTALNVILNSAPLDPDDPSKGITATILDITERKRAEEVIKESEERFNKAFHASPNLGSVLTMDEGRFIDANAEHTRITGYERREIIGKTTLELNLWFNPEQRREFYNIINTEGRLKDFEILMRTKSGEIRTLLFSAEQIMLRGIKCLVVSALDITERKEAEERINHLNLMLRSVRNVDQLITREKDRSLLIQKVCDSLVESRSFISTWIVLLDENQQPVIWAGANMNKEFPALIESLKQGEIPQCVKKALSNKQVVITEDQLKACKGCPTQCGNADTGSMTVRLEIEGKNYGILCASISKKLIQDTEEISLFDEVAMDIAFALRDMELVAANELQEQERLRMAKMETIGMLAGGIAHDFNNLLTGIMGNIGLVKTYISSSDPTYEMLDEAEGAAVRARDLTQQLLTFAKGGKPLKKLVNAADLIKGSAEFALRGSKVKLELSFSDELWPIEADEGQISQVINNLVINADEAMPIGGRLKISAVNQAVKKSDALPLRGGNYIRVDITDTGIGMSREQLQSIFEPYFTTKQRGSGLGLTTAYSVVKNHNGAILVESTQNKGSSFHIYLPATKKALKGAKKLTVEESRQAGGKILIMDDEEVIRKMLKNMLGMAGYIVEVSADGVEALEKYQQAKKARDPFNAVIMDLTIPGGMGGKEAVKKLLEIDPQATVIVSSGYATDPIMSDYRKYGFKAVIAKPYSVKQLRELLSRLLTRKKR